MTQGRKRQSDGEATGHAGHSDAESWEEALRTVAADVEPDSGTDALDTFFVSAEEAAANQSVAVGDAYQMSVVEQGPTELLAFWVGHEEYGIDIVQIQEIIKVPAITTVPRGPACVLGIISLRGTIVAVADLRRILGMEQQGVTRASRILVLRGDGEPVGLLVDRVSSVVRLDHDAIEAVPRTMQHAASDLLQGLGREGDRMLIILELGAVIAATEYVG